MIKSLPADAEDAGDLGSVPRWRISLGGKNGNPFQYSCWEIPWTEEPGGLQSMQSQRIGHDGVTEHAHVYKHFSNK